MWNCYVERMICFFVKLSKAPVYSTAIISEASKNRRKKKRSDNEKASRIEPPGLC